jgi:indolepyruvate ferredoxin oxidoreductase
VHRVTAQVTAAGELARLLAIRIPELISYQDERYAATYVEFVERVRVAEARAVPGSTALAEAVARNLFHLMAYKDEYEVAQLCLDPAIDEAVEEQFGSGSRTKIRLHPPVLRALGMKNKIALGEWVRPGLGLLYRLRGLRGTRLDPFGYAAVRRIERALIVEYRSVVENLITSIDAESLAVTVKITELPAMIRGYESVKMRRVADYQEKLAELVGKTSVDQP